MGYFWALGVRTPQRGDRTQDSPWILRHCRRFRPDRFQLYQLIHGLLGQFEA